MRSRYTVRELERAHFVTSTIVDWLPVFTTAACCDILTGSLDFCRREKGLRLYAWVIMENHFHAVVQADDLPRVMADLKKFTAGKLLAQLEAERRTWLLNIVVSKDTPLCNAWLTLLHGVGVEAERHGDSTGVIKELIA